MILNSGNHVVVIGIKDTFGLFFLYFEHTLWYIIRVPHDVIMLSNPRFSSTKRGRNATTLPLRSRHERLIQLIGIACEMPLLCIVTEAARGVFGEFSMGNSWDKWNIMELKIVYLIVLHRS